MIRALCVWAIVMTLATSAFAEDVLLQSSNFVYKGAFRIPQGAKDNSSRTNALSFKGMSISFRAARSGVPNGSIYIVNRDMLVSELAIPVVKNPRNATDCPSGAISCLNTASWLQGPMDLTQGNLYNSGVNHASGTSTDDSSIWGTLVYNNRLIGSALGSYDSGAIYTHFSSVLDWDNTISTSPGFRGLYQVNAYTSDPIKNAGFVGGYMAEVPESWRTALGAPALTGMIRESTVGNGSFGPSLVAFDPDALTGDNTTVVSGTILAGYPGTGVFYNYPGSTADGLVAPQSRASLNLWVRGAVFPVGSKSVVVFGATGLGVTGQGDGCYGENTSNVTQIKTKSEITSWWNANGQPSTYTCGSTSININATTGVPENPCCYDAAFDSKGQHSYPYIARAWFYNAEDLAAVKAGTKTYDSVLPYAQWDLGSYAITPYRTWDTQTGIWSTSTNPNYAYTRNNGDGDLPFAVAYDGIMGAAYDPATQTVYLAQKNSDQPGLEPFNLIHVFQLDGLSGAISGICGSSNGLALSSAPTIGLCTAGTASAVTGTGPWTWTCAGSGGGSTANCSATLLEIPSGGTSAAVACSAIAGFR